MDRWAMFVEMIFLGICVLTDIRSRRISIGVCIFVAFLWGAVRWKTGEMQLLKLPANLIPGMGLYLLALISGERIGKGDAWMVLTSGVIWGGMWSLLLFEGALFSATLHGGICRIVQKENKEICFAPHLFLAGIGICIWRIHFF